MHVTAPSPFVLARTFVFRRYITLRNAVTAPSSEAAEAARQARKRLKKQAKHERLRNFFGWCAGCEAYGSIF
ncbi:hypothetical protein [Hymenobacter pini]|uniref:hypothetical protein n=1 Tax=Hymenobacter pini TaxID=2880879 RepID=UPI001CF25303|nr:hypothetical protein [Hymenobacter pini]MCA8831101.1 hypothetical protein [Hymenobacter pini]